MFITVKRHEREKQEIAGASNRLTEAILKSSTLGLFLLDAKDRIQPQVSKSLATLFRRQEFNNLSFEKLIGPVVSAKTLSTARSYVARLLESNQDSGDSTPLDDVEVRLPNGEGGFDTAHYSFHFTAVDAPERCWLVRVSDITARVQQQRELEDLRTNLETHAEILRGVLQSGGARFGAFLQKTDASMKSINNVLKKPAREADAFRGKLEETLAEVDRVRRDAASLKLAGLETAARSFEDSLQELRSRGNLSGGDFLPLAVKLDQLYVKFALIRTLSTQASTPRHTDVETVRSADVAVTENGTQIIEAPKFIADLEQKAAAPKRMAVAGSLDSTLSTLTDLVAQEYHKTVVLECSGLDLVPARYQATIKNVAIQLIRNAVMHGVETPDERQAAGKPLHGTLQVEFRALENRTYELLFEDDGRGLDPDKVRRTAVARGLLTEEAASRLRDRQAIKLIFKSGFTTLPSGLDEPAHGAGMSLVRRYVHEAGGKIALASLMGHETRFKMTLPPVEAETAQVA